MLTKDLSSSSIIYDPKTLMQEFKEHIYRLDNRNAPSKLSYEYKKIHSELAISNKHKRDRLCQQTGSIFGKSKMQSRCYTASQTSDGSRRRFKKIKPTQQESVVQDPGSKLFQGILQLAGKTIPKTPSDSVCDDLLRFMIPSLRTKSAQKPVDPQFIELDQKILMQNMFKQKLQQQIANLKQSFNQLKKDLQAARQQYREKQQKQNKHKEVSYLSMSVQQQTEQVMANNLRDYRDMLKKQEQTIANLKRYRNSIRRENQEFQSKFLSGNKSKNKYQRPMTYTFKNSQQKKNTDFHEVKQSFHINSTFNRNSIKFMQSLQKVLDLLQVKQPDYQEIKNSECTKMHNIKLINTDLLDEDRAKKISNIYKFQQRFGIRLESASQIVLRVFQKLKQRNDKKEKHISELISMKEDFQKDDKAFNQGISIGLQQDFTEHSSENFKETQLKLITINSNSKLLIKFIGVFYLVLSKFKYMFKMALTLNIEKKNFQEYLMQIQKNFQDGLYFHGFQSEFIKSLTAMHPLHHDHVNITEFIQIAQKAFPEVEQTRLKNMIYLFFSDIRNLLILRKSWVLQDLKTAPTGEYRFQNFLQSLKTDCQQIYDQKLKALTNLYLNCLKSVTLNKYEKKIVSTQSSLDGTLFLPAYRVKRSSQISETTESDTHPKAMLDNNNQDQDDSAWTPIQSDPRTIIFKLGKMRNDQQQKFKVLNFNVEGNSYAKKGSQFSKSPRISNQLCLKDISNNFD